jgi:hypothetical protein
MRQSVRYQLWLLRAYAPAIWLVLVALSVAGFRTKSHRFPPWDPIVQRSADG